MARLKKIGSFSNFCHWKKWNLRAISVITEKWKGIVILKK